MPVPDALRPRLLELRARAMAASGDYWGAARTRAEMHEQLSGFDRTANQKEILGLLAKVGSSDLQQRAAAMRPGDSTLIVLPDSTNWHAVPMLDPFTNRRTLDRSGAIYPLTVEADSAALYASQRSTGIYIGLPNGPAKRGLEQLAASFDIGAERRYTRGPYAISAYRLTPRAVSPISSK